MPVEERRRIALHNHIAATWGEEAADTLFDLITPAGHELATRADIEELRREMQAGFASVEARFTGVEARFAGVDAQFATAETGIAARFTALESQLESMEHRLSGGFERRITEAVSMQTRTLVFSQLGALVTIAALAFGLR